MSPRANEFRTFFQGFRYEATPQEQRTAENAARIVKQLGCFTASDGYVYFPLWYPALILALAGVAALRFRRQFSIRWALITVSVVAALLGIVVAL